MHKDKRNIILSLLISLLFMGGTFSFAYFLMDITGTGSDVSKVTTGTLNLLVSDSSININNLAPIDDIDYKDYAYKKEFTINNSGTLNGCSNIYLNINNISSSLKSEYLKYKLISNTNIYTGDFSNIENNKLLLADSSMVEAGINKKYTLYIWISYDKNIVQNDMLGTMLNGNIYIESKDCRSVNYDFETLALYVDNEKVDKLDKTKNYSLESYTCANGESVNYNNDKRSITIEPIENETKCSLYFKYNASITEYLISNYNKFSLTKINQSTVGNQNYNSVEFRYQGKDVNNYITFNGETIWRIIGVFEVESYLSNNETDTNSSNFKREYRVKIVRDSLADKMYFSKNLNGTNYSDYVRSDIKKYLNGTYYDSLDDISKTMISSVKWHLGALKYNSQAPRYGKLKDIYTQERGTDVLSGSYNSWNGKVGLIYPSDYMYASSECYDKVNNNSFKDANYYGTDVQYADKDYRACTSTNYLHIGAIYWNINPTDAGKQYVSSSTATGTLVCNSANAYQFDIRPSVYLNADVLYVSGDGSKTKPFVIKNK